MDHIDYMLEAVKEAESGIAAGDGGPFGAVIVKDGKIIGRGHNRVVVSHDPTAHGEVMAIRDATSKLGTFDLSGSIIYTTGYPCPMCLGAILWANIDRAYYGCNLEDTEKIGFRDSRFYEISSDEGKKAEFIREIGRKECLELYDHYLLDEKRTNY